MSHYRTAAILTGVAVTLSADPFDATNGYDTRTKNVRHPSAYIAQMCYTATEDSQGKMHNPCFSCHINNTPPNYIMDDAAMQAVYAFPEPARTNPFANHFRDFTAEVARMSDAMITAYVDQNNYQDAQGQLILAQKLAEIPGEWDYDSDGKWGGYVPDCYFNFDEQGFDRDPRQGYTGWTAFAYYPFLGTFWPTNGSTDDVLIRLDTPFRVLHEGDDFNATVYGVNLAIVDAVIHRRDVPIDPVDERALGVDLDKDGNLSRAEWVRYGWKPLKKRFMYYVGEAHALQKAGKLHLAAGLFPEGTEFLHSVRYIKSDPSGKVSLAPRMKELRYAKKVFWLTYATLQNKGLAELQEASLSPDQLSTFRGTMEIGLGNNLGWLYQGFIEDRFGELRPQSYEETLNCMGCHSGLAATTDGTFAFARKFDAKTAWRRGWYHGSQKDLRGIPEPKLLDGTYEYSNYLRQNGHGDEFRENDEVLKKFYDAEGHRNEKAFAALHEDMTTLLYPSHKRALMLNKAYKALVEEQRFIEGKAAHVKPFKNVHRTLKPDQPTGNDVWLLP